MRLPITSTFCLLILLLTGCNKDRFYRKYKVKVPVYTSHEDFRNSVQFEAAKTITQEGKIYIKDHHLFVVEPNEGIHFIDNSNPSSPITTGFLRVQGCSGLAIKGQYLYVNALIDLVVFDVSDMTNPVEVSRSKNAFPNALPESKENYPIAEIDTSLGVVTSWKIEEVKEEVDNHGGGGNMGWPQSTTWGAETMANTNYAGNSGTGIAGSIAKMTIVNDYLYVMADHELKPFDIQSPAQPDIKAGIRIWREVETLFPHGDKIFMGTTTGMMIYSTSIPEAPQHISTITHATACDPVVVQGNYAYVTVRTGTTCQGTLNQLDVIDISDIYNPQAVASFPMTNPHGLGIDGNTLFICDGSAGLRMFDASTPADCGNNQVARHRQIVAIDVIPFNNVAIVIGENGLYQYDYSDHQNLNLLSTISF